MLFSLCGAAVIEKGRGDNLVSSTQTYLKGVVVCQHSPELNRPCLWTRIYVEQAAIRGYAGCKGAVSWSGLSIQAVVSRLDGRPEGMVGRTQIKWVKNLEGG